MQEQTPANTSESAKYLSIPEAAVRLGVSADTIRRRIKSGELPGYIFAGKYRLASNDVDALMKRAAA